MGLDVPNDLRLAQHLEACIPGDRRPALARGEAIPDRVEGAALFAAMQATMARLHDVLTPGGTRVTLAMKAAVHLSESWTFGILDPNAVRTPD